MQVTITALERAIHAAGGNAALARQLGVHRSAVTHWLRLGVPAAQAVRLSAMTGISVCEFRPDLAHATHHAAAAAASSPHDPVSSASNEVAA